jgi:hypothetical protein
MPAIIPTALFSGYVADSTTITIPLSALPVLTAAEADEVTGDGREVMRAIIDAATVRLEAMPAASRPAYFSITRGSIAGVTPTTIRRTYTITFEESISATGTSLRSES